MELKLVLLQSQLVDEGELQVSKIEAALCQRRASVSVLRLGHVLWLAIPPTAQNASVSLPFSSAVTPPPSPSVFGFLSLPDQQATLL